MPKKLSSLENYIVIESASDFKQDDWTFSFCEVFGALRKAKIIQTNRAFADEIGLHQTGLSHALRGRRNFPDDYRLKAEKALIKYGISNGKVLSYKGLNDLPKATATDRINHKKAAAATIDLLKERHNSLCEEIVRLQKEWSRLKREVDSLMNRLIKLQAEIIEDLEK